MMLGKVLPSRPKRLITVEKPGSYGLKGNLQHHGCFSFAVEDWAIHNEPEMPRRGRLPETHRPGLNIRLPLSGKRMDHPHEIDRQQPIQRQIHHAYGSSGILCQYMLDSAKRVAYNVNDRLYY